jgi:hypothetical protein
MWISCRSSGSIASRSLVLPLNFANQRSMNGTTFSDLDKPFPFVANQRDLGVNLVEHAVVDITCSTG